MTNYQLYLIILQAWMIVAAIYKGTSIGNFAKWVSLGWFIVGIMETELFKAFLKGLMQ